MIASVTKLEGRDVVFIITDDGAIWKLVPDSQTTFRLERVLYLGNDVMSPGVY